MSTDEVKDKLEKITYALKCLENGSHKEIPSDFFDSKVSKLQQLKEVYQKKLNLLTEEIKFDESEVKVIAQEVGTAVGQAAREYGGEIDNAVATDFNDQSFTIDITYKNDNEESYQFYISDDTLFLLDRSHDREISDVGVNPSGEAIVNKDVVKNEMQKYFKSMNEMDNIRPTDAQFNKAKEADRLAAHPEKDTIQAIYALMQKEKETVTPNESSCNSHEEVNEDLNLHKVEVSIRDARRAQEIMYDQFDHQFEMNGSNVYLFDDPQTAFDAMMTLGSHDIEVDNIADFDDEIEEGTDTQDLGTYKQAELRMKECPTGCIATGGGYGPWTKISSNTWKNKRGMLSNSQSLASHIAGFSDFSLDESSCNSTHEGVNELFGNDMFDNRPHGETEFMGVKINKDKDKEDKQDKKPIKEFTSTGKLTNHEDFKFLAQQLTQLCNKEDVRDCLKILLTVGELGLDLGYADAKSDAEMAAAHKPVNERVPDHKAEEVTSKLDPDFIFALSRAAHAEGYTDARDHLGQASDALEREMTVGENLTYKEPKGIDKVAGGIPYRREGNNFIISMSLPDDVKERIIKRCKEAGYKCSPNQAGGVTIFKKGLSENRFLAASMEDLEQVIRNLAHTAEMSEDEAIEMAISKLEAMLDGRDDMDESVASTSRDLDKCKADIKTHLQMYKDAEGDKAKRAAVQMLKTLNDKKKALVKDLESKVAGTNRNQELDETQECASCGCSESECHCNKGVNEGDKEAQDAYSAVKDLIQKHARKLNDDDAYTFHELLKDFFNRAI